MIVNKISHHCCLLCIVKVFMVPNKRLWCCSRCAGGMLPLEACWDWAVDQLLDHGADVNCIAISHRTALHYAIEHCPPSLDKRQHGTQSSEVRLQVIQLKHRNLIKTSDPHLLATTAGIQEIQEIQAFQYALL